MFHGSYCYWLRFGVSASTSLSPWPPACHHHPFLPCKTQVGTCCCVTLELQGTSSCDHFTGFIPLSGCPLASASITRAQYFHDRLNPEMSLDWRRLKTRDIRRVLSGFVGDPLLSKVVSRLLGAYQNCLVLKLEKVYSISQLSTSPSCPSWPVPKYCIPARD